MDSQSRKEAAEIKKLPISVLEYLPAPRWRSLSALIVVVILLLIFAGYTLNAAIRYGRLEEELEKYESLWESKEISNYQYTLMASNNKGISVVAVRVEEGSSAISERLESRYRGDINEVLPDIDSYDTVPDLFDRIRDVLEAREENGSFKLDIRYDEDIGYPLCFALRHYRGELSSMRLYSYTISDFKILEPMEIRYARLEAELDSHEKLWESKEISGYEYTLRARTGEGYSEVYVRVKDGISASEVSVKGIPLDINSFDTVPDLFNRIRKAIESREEEGFNRLSIKYNEDTGYPTYIALRDSYRAGDPGVYSFSIFDFKILEQGQTAK